jgi:hypothetical protein
MKVETKQLKATTVAIIGNYIVEQEPETATLLAHKGTAVSVRIPIKDKNVAEALAEITELLGF